MESLLRQTPGQEDMWIGADLNGHVGGTRTGFEREHGRNSWGDRNAEGEEILQFAQAHDLGMDICIQTKKRVKPRRRKQQIKWWRLKDRDENRKFASKVEEKINDGKECNQLEALLLDTAKSVLGQTTGKGAYNEKESWWLNEEVQKAVKEKRLAFRQYQQSRCDEDKEEFKEGRCFHVVPRQIIAVIML